MKADIEKTRAYYSSRGPESLCNCGYCQNYCARVKAAYLEVALYLDSLGVDIEKPFETMPLELDENGYLEYCGCQYVVFGSCPEDFTHRIGDVTFGRSDCHPNTKWMRSTLCWTFIRSGCRLRSRKARALNYELFRLWR